MFYDHIVKHGYLPYELKKNPNSKRDNMGIIDTQCCVQGL